MAISKENMVALGREVRKVLAFVFKAGAKTPASTKEVLSYMIESKSAILTGGEKDSYNMLRALAEHGYPGVGRGEPQQSRIYGKMVAVRPWIWTDAGEDAVSTWATKMSSGGRSSAKTRDLEARVEALEAQMKNLLASPAATVAQ